MGGGGSGLVCTVSAFISNNVSAQKKVARAENNTLSGRNPENWILVSYLSCYVCHVFYQVSVSMPLDSTPVYCNLSFAVCAAGRTKGILNKAVGAALLDKIYVITPILNHPRVSYAFQKLF